MKPKEIRDLSPEEMLQKEKDFTEELFNLKFQSAMGQLENTMRVKQVKKDIARVKTIFQELRRGQGK
ncbi:MAG: 50S ribosomal protein L29 [Thermodesulfobacteriota bacterium]|jgi:large subunit ribosomal protein L29|nr:MAG: 50S ribosomal protein L29 [Thermodesulfobacteriota bacterium]